MTSHAWNVLVRYLCEGKNSVILPPDFAQTWLDEMLEKGHPAACSRGHRWTVESTKVRARDRRDVGKGLTIERTCLECEKLRTRKDEGPTITLQEGDRLWKNKTSRPRNEDLILLALESDINSLQGITAATGLTDRQTRHALSELKMKGLVDYGLPRDGIYLSTDGEEWMRTHIPAPRHRRMPPRSELVATIIAAGVEDRDAITKLARFNSEETLYSRMCYLRGRGVSKTEHGKTSVSLRAVAELIAMYGWPPGLPDDLDLSDLKAEVARVVAQSREERLAVGRRVRALINEQWRTHAYKRKRNKAEIALEIERRKRQSRQGQIQRKAGELKALPDRSSVSVDKRKAA